ncbi:MAG: WG repeat-containing protein [Clostridia bacterium]|nr:WG repeat-containing protein [Clostridia bacterium]
MDRARGRRFDDEPKLNMKKVFATLVAVIVFIMVIISIVNLLNKDKNAGTVMQIPTRYFTIFESGKYGVIDGTGNVIIKPVYDEMIIIPNSSKDVFVCTYDVDYNTGTYKTKILNASNQERLKNYNNLTALENANGTEIWYEDNILKFEKDGLYGLVDFSGKEIVPAEYLNIYALEGVAKNIVIEKDGFKGIVNSTLGTVAVECNYNDVTSLSTGNSDNGYIVSLDGKYGVVSSNGKEILPCNYEEIKHVYGNNMYVVKEEGVQKVINNSLNVIKDSGFDDILEINGDYITISLNGLKGVVNAEGIELIPAQYEDLKFAHENYFIAKSGAYGIISTENIVLVDFGYENISFIGRANFYTAENATYTTDVISGKLEIKLKSVIISELNVDKGYMRVRQDGKYKYYNFNFEEKKNTEVLTNNTLFLVNKDGKYGYTNKEGELIVNYIYDDAKEQNEFGYCVVKQNGLWGVLKQDGTVLLKPSVNLDDSLYINFISSWHQYNDPSLNLYIK